MIGALKMEMLRIRTITSSYVLAGLALVFTMLISLFTVVFAPKDALAEFGGLDVLGTFIATGGASVRVVPVMGLPFVLVIAVLAVGHDYRYGTNKAVLTAVPNRLNVFVAKLLVVAVWVAVTTVVMGLANLLLALVWLGTDALGDVWLPLLNMIVFFVGSAWAAMGVTWVLRNQVGSLVLVLVYTYVIEPIISGVLMILAGFNSNDVDALTDYLPAGAGRRLLWSPYDAMQVDFSTGDAHVPMDLVPSYFVFAAGILVVLALGLTSFLKRDA